MSDINQVEDDLILVYDAPDLQSGEIVRATLEAAGIHAVIQNARLGPGDGEMTFLGMAWGHSVYVASADVEAAREVLNTPQMSEEELAAQEEADPMTLEEAEARVKDV